MTIFAKSPVELTTENFAPFGRVLEPHAPQYSKSGAGWACYSNIDRIHPDAPLMVGLVYCQEIPNVITALEAHTSREELLWATTRDLYMAVAEPFDLNDPQRKPRADSCVIFRIKAGQAMVIGKGVWHSPAFSVTGEPAYYYFLVEDKPDSINQDANPWIEFADCQGIRLTPER
jgi:Ureidoglycolate hydrolase